MACTQRIQLAPMLQLAEAINGEDDWTGTTDAVARRRAQTRLNTRAYRKRKALAKKAQEAANNGVDDGLRGQDEAAPPPAPPAPPAAVECWDYEHDTVALIPASRMKQLYNPRRPMLDWGRTGKKQYQEEEEQRRKTIVFPLCPDHLITLLQFNVLRALAVNRTLISGILTTPLDCGEEELIHTVPYPSRPDLLPPTLLPTLLQQTVPHGDWIDMFPSPEARDRLIRAAGTFDEDELWADCIGGLFEGFPADEVERRGIIAWYPPWDMTGWEVTEGFRRRWGWMLRGIPGWLEATNRRREERGDAPLAEVEEVDEEGNSTVSAVKT